MIALTWLLACPGPATTEPLCTADVQHWVEPGGLGIQQSLCADLQLSATVYGTGELSVGAEAVDAPVFELTITAGEAGGTFEGLTLRGPWAVEGSGEIVWWRQGYQSWAWSGVTDFQEAALDRAGQPEVGGDGDSTDVFNERAGTSWWMALLGRAEGASLGVGVLSAERTKFHVAVTEDELVLTYGLRGGSIDLAPGETLALAPLWIQAGADPTALAHDYADHAAT